MREPGGEAGGRAEAGSLQGIGGGERARQPRAPRTRRRTSRARSARTRIGEAERHVAGEPEQRRRRRARRRWRRPRCSRAGRGRNDPATSTSAGSEQEWRRPAPRIAAQGTGWPDSSRLGASRQEVEAESPARPTTTSTSRTRFSRGAPLHREGHGRRGRQRHRMSRLTSAGPWTSDSRWRPASGPGRRRRSWH